MNPLASNARLADGRYRLLEPLGQGGMAEVWRAWDERLSVERAIKVLSARHQRSASAAVRFEREARVMAQLEHPHVVPVHDIGEEGGRVYLVMSLLDHSLQDELELRGQLKAARVVRMAVGVLDALAAAHDAGVVHRDVKPHNVLVDERDAPRLTDFGIATDPQAKGLTRTGAIMGTLAYMAPEQRASARRVDGRADVYAVGALIYALCTGADSTELDHPDGREARLSSLPALLVDFVDRATRRRPEQRHASAREALEELQDLATHLPDRPSPQSLRVPQAHQPTGVTMDLDALAAMEGQTGPTLRPSPDAATVADASAATVARPAETELLQVAPLPEPEPPRARWRGALVAGIGVPALGLLVLGTGWLLREASAPPAALDRAVQDARPAPAPPEPARPPEPVVPAPVAPAPSPAAVPSPELPPPRPVEPAPRPTTPSPAAEPEPEPEPEPQATGPVIHINSLPTDAILLIDRQEVGRTPWEGVLGPGQHRLEFRHDDVVRTTAIVSGADHPTSICWDLTIHGPCPR